jgi:hypothetical protein
MFSWMLERDTYQFEVNEIQYDFRCADSDELKVHFKIKYGKGASKWEYVNEAIQMVPVYDLKDVPQYAIDDFNKGNRGRVKASRAISWIDYDKKDRIKLIDSVINIMKTIGVDSQKFHDILDGIRED